jgi:DnaJ family protein A protein 2
MAKVKETVFYDRLGVDPSADNDAIKKAYRKMALKYHPDRNPGDETAHQKFQEIQIAYEVLIDEQKRQIYDQYGEEGMKQGHGEGFGGDIFDILRGMGGGGRQRERRGEDVVHPLGVKLEDLYNGKTAKLQLTKKVVCTTCSGKGAKEGGKVQKCSTCKGQGIRVVLRQLAPGLVQQMQTVCGDCNGEGNQIAESDKCPKCKGEKVVSETKVLEVGVDKGMSHGQKITFRGEADQTPGLPPGDVIIVLQQHEHDTFKRDGADLHIERKVNLVEALCGFQFVLPHLDGRKLLVKSAAGDVLKPNAVKCVLNEGMPMHKRPFDKGRLFIHFEIEFPAAGSVTSEHFKQLVAMFPAMKPKPITVSESEVDVCELRDVDPSQQQRRGDAYHEDEDDDEGPPRAQCAAGAQ